MQRRSTLLLAFGALLVTPLAAQQTPPSQIAGASPAECLENANAWRTQQVTRLRAEKQPVDAAALLAETRRLAKDCGARFTPENTPSAGLVALANLYNFVGNGEGALAAVQRALAATDLTERQHADVVLLAIGNALASRDAFAGINEEAEALVRQIDALPDSLVDRKIRAHQLLLGQYGYADIDDGIQAHAAELLRLGRAVGDLRAIGQAYDDLVRAAADYLHPDSAMRLLDAAEHELGATGHPMAAMLASSRARYSLVGTPAPAVTGDVWLNTKQASPVVKPGDGKVYLVQFTAHWCAPCRNSYPGMLRLAERFRGTEFEVIFVTELYGNFEGKPATEAEELEADAHYYAEKHGIPFRIAVNHFRKAEAGAGQQAPLVNRQYGVNGIPQIVVVDRQGVIRQIVIGWDRGNEQRLGSCIEGLLKGVTQ